MHYVCNAYDLLANKPYLSFLETICPYKISYMIRIPLKVTFQAEVTTGLLCVVPLPRLVLILAFYIIVCRW